MALFLTYCPPEIIVPFVIATSMRFILLSSYTYSKQLRVDCFPDIPIVLFWEAFLILLLSSDESNIYCFVVHVAIKRDAIPEFFVKMPGGFYTMIAFP